MKETFLKLKRVSLVLIILGVISSCSDVLDVTVNGILSEDDFYKTEDDAMQGLIATYDGYQSSYNAIWPSVYLVREIIGDDVNAGGSDETDQAPFQQMDDFVHDSQNAHIRDAWNNLYSTVFRANKVIEKTIPDTDLKKRIVAEAKFLRAMIYFDLVSLWGGVPLILKDVPAAEYTIQVRASRADVFAQIETDLADAIVDLPTKTAYAAGDKFRASKGAAQALLGKAFLYEEKFSEAAAQFELVINSNEYDLEDDGMAVFTKAGTFGKESLFELNYVDSEGYDWGNFPWGNNTESNTIIQLMGPRGDFFTPATGDDLTGGWGFNTPTDELYQAYVAAGDDTRRQLYMMSQAELEAAGGAWSEPDAWDYEGYFRRKYGHFTSESVVDGVAELNYATNFVLIRYADVLLMAAEANFGAGVETKAKTYLNEVRSRTSTSLPDVTASGAALLNAIVLERRLELAFEGHRFVDLVRWDLANTELSDLGFVAGKHEVLPIPNADVISGKLEQNPGY